MYKQKTVIIPETKPANGSFNLLKVIVMVGLPYVHILESYKIFGVLTGVSESFENVVCGLTVFGPSIFMICLGLGLANTSSVGRIRKVGIQMIIIYEMLNLIRFCIPYFIMWKAGISDWLYILAICESDIYLFVGLFYILLSFYKQAKLSTFKIFLISVVMLVINIFVSSNVSLDNFLLTIFLGNVVTVGYDSYFPLFGWCIYPCIGMLIEEKVLSMDFRQRNIAFGIMLGIGSVMLAATIGAIRFFGGTVVETLADFAVTSRYGLGQVGLIIGIALITISVFYFIYQIVKENPVERFIISLSPLVFPYYILQWIGASLVSYYVVGIDNLFFEGSFRVNAAQYLLISTIVTVICMLITYKKGFTFSRFIFKISDYTKWIKKKAEN